MSNKMLIDATHQEETRVVVLRDKRVEDFDFETATKKPLRGNIYLAKVTRVEPSLQAAFIEYGGNKHGFLAFSEIHPDYYQIPQADRQALLEELEEDDAQEAPRPKKPSTRKSTRTSSRSSRSRSPKAESAPQPYTDPDAPQPDVAAEDVIDAMGETASATAPSQDAESTGDLQSSAPGEQPGGDDAVVAQVDAPSGEVEADGENAAGAQEAAPSDETADAAEPVEAAPFPQASPQEESDAAEPADAATHETAPASEDEARVDADTVAAAAPQEDAAPVEAGTQAAAEAGTEEAATEEAAEAPKKPAPKRRRRTTTKKSDDGLADPVVTEDDEAGEVTAIGEADVLEEIPERRRRTPKKTYKIQEVIKRRQILLVQVVKEERGTKGAALTTYLSLAGRYSVLMPNTNRGGGVSRKITDNADRKRLKSLVAELDVPQGMGIILRTAGAARTKTEIKRDFEYLLRLWESVRDLTLQSIAPELVYEEGNLVKRAIRDLYSKEINEVLVSGDAAYREAKDFMKMLMPSHAKNVKAYREPTPIFTAYGVESQLDAMFSPTVMLPSKGSIVINPTEALVAIDVNSGRSTKESNIEDTATKTNLEAADEVARQLRLRDLAGLIVIDFIDMDDKRHNRQVEKRLKDALKMDRSRIQVGRISAFGLMEMSRQRIRQGMVETSMIPCPHCQGTGQVRSTLSVALYCLRSLEEHLLKRSENHVTIRTSSAVALYILNQKRTHLRALEDRFGLDIGVHADEQLSGQLMEIVTGAPVERAPGEEPPVAQLAPDAVVVEPDTEADGEVSADEGAGGERSSSSRRRRRRRRRGGSAEAQAEQPHDTAEATQASAEDDEPLTEGLAEAAADGPSSEADGEGDGDAPRGRRRRGRRGGRRHRREDDGVEASAEGSDERVEATDAEGGASDSPVLAVAPDADQTAEPTPEAVEAKDGLAQDGSELDADAETGSIAPSEPLAEPAADEAAHNANADTDEGVDTEIAAETGAESETDAEEGVVAEGANGTLNGGAEEEAGSVEMPPEPEPAPAPEPTRPRRVGWWQRRSFF
ncbi:MAG: Rne/Rng family ribonuclease [Pseudomonadota bacterium]